MTLRKNIIWFRGLERKFNIIKLEEKVLELFNNDELNKVINNANNIFFITLLLLYWSLQNYRV